MNQSRSKKPTRQEVFSFFEDMLNNLYVTDRFKNHTRRPLTSTDFDKNPDLLPGAFVQRMTKRDPNILKSLTSDMAMESGVKFWNKGK